jgi:hypothetical protein
MRFFSTLLFGCIMLLATTGRAQVFPVDTLVKNGPLNARINLVFVGDGYQASEMGQYITDVNRAVSAIFRQEPFVQYRRYFNVFAIRVPSAQSGTSHPRTAPDCNTVPNFPAVTVNTYFRTAFDNAGVHRAIVTNGQSTLAAVLGNSFPQYTKAIVMVNTPEYGGTGGANITMTAHAAAAEVMIHEMGHTFANLGDEYYAGAQFMNERSNRTQPAVIGALRWQSWLGQNGIVNLPFAEDATWSKPHSNCKMQFLGAPFCSVCVEATIERIHSSCRALESYSPTSQLLPTPTQNLPFSVSLLRPTPNTLRVTWKVDGVVFGGNTEQVTIPQAMLATGTHTVQAEVNDTTTLSHSTTHRVLHRYMVYWDIDNTVTGTKVAASSAEYKVETFPNPVADVLNLSYTLSKPSEVQLTVLDATGRRVKTLTRARQAAGTYDYQLRSAELGLRQAGIYTLLLDIDGMVVSRKLVKD